MQCRRPELGAESGLFHLDPPEQTHGRQYDQGDRTGEIPKCKAETQMRAGNGILGEKRLILSARMNCKTHRGAGRTSRVSRGQALTPGILVPSALIAAYRASASRTGQEPRI